MMTGCIWGALVAVHLWYLQPSLAHRVVDIHQLHADGTGEKTDNKANNEGREGASHNVKLEVVGATDVTATDAQSALVSTETSKQQLVETRAHEHYATNSSAANGDETSKIEGPKTAAPLPIKDPRAEMAIDAIKAAPAVIDETRSIFRGGKGGLLADYSVGGVIRDLAGALQTVKFSSPRDGNWGMCTQPLQGGDSAFILKDQWGSGAEGDIILTLKNGRHVQVSFGCPLLWFSKNYVTVTGGGRSSGYRLTVEPYPKSGHPLKFTLVIDDL